MRRWWLVGLILLGSGLWPGSAAVAQDRRVDLTRALRATVLILVLDDGGQLFATGSGTVMDAEEGYLLTNFHVVGDTASGELYNRSSEAIIGLMPENLKGTPLLSYRARFVGGDPLLDLALLQISGLFDDPRAALPADLGLTDIVRADSETLMIGDALYVLGYPGLGGNTVTVSTGLVSGFLDEDDGGVFEWIKTDAEVNRGNSGGLAVNERGEFIGVPSAGVSELETAGKISLIRTGNLALDFYAAALLGELPSLTGTGARVDAVAFGAGIDRANAVTRPAVNFASGLTDLYASFRFAGFRNGQELSIVWYVDGKQDSTDRLIWQEGEAGQSWVSIYNASGLADGFYELELLLDGVSLYRGGVTIGAITAGMCRFGPITFATAISDVGEPVDPGARFGRVTTVYAFFAVTGVGNGTPWRTAWYFEEQPALVEDHVWAAGDAATQWVSLTHAEGLPAGEFALELYCNDALQQRATFAITGRPDANSRAVHASGSVLDRDNGRRPVVGATVILLQPGVTVAAWAAADYSASLVHGRATTDRSGNFTLDAQVTPGERYSIVVSHADYETARSDAHLIPTGSSDPFQLEIRLQQK